MCWRLYVQFDATVLNPVRTVRAIVNTVGSPEEESGGYTQLAGIRDMSWTFITEVEARSAELRVKNLNLASIFTTIGITDASPAH